MTEEGEKAWRVEYIKQEEHQPFLCLPPPPLTTECLLIGVRCSPGCQLEYPLTFSLWPTAPQNAPQSCQLRHPVGSASSESVALWVQVLAVSTSLTDVTLHSLVLLTSKALRVCALCACVACHGPICPRAPGLSRGSCCSVMESCLLQTDPVTRAPCFHPY